MAFPNQHSSDSPVEPADRCCPIVELRQYTLRPGKRDTLIALFERELIEAQEQAGMHLIGQFHDLDDSNRFVWVRGFCDMETRRQALRAFYTGGVWREHREAANETMVDSDDVLLLRPTSPDSAFDLHRAHRPPSGADVGARGLVVATILQLKQAADLSLLEYFDQRLAPALVASGSHLLASFVTEEGPNTFPDLPVREGENVYVWFSLFESLGAYNRHTHELARTHPVDAQIWEPIRTRLVAPPQVLRLAPTPRSLLRWSRERV